MLFSRTHGSLTAMLVLGGLSALAAAPAHAQITYTFTGFEQTEAQRLFRDANPSSYMTAPKAFPGTVNTANNFQTYTFVNPYMSGAAFNVSVVNADINTFYSVYNGSFNPANLATNYLGDGGSSGATSFSILATGSEKLVLVLNTVQGVGTASTSTFTPTFAPVPEASTVASLGVLLVGLGGLTVRARKKAPASAA